MFGLDLAARGGSALAVLGPNGAGKSTLGRAVAGLVPVCSGRVWFDGQDITGWAAHRVRRAGLAYIPEGRGIFPGLSVLDNLRMAVRQLPSKKARETAIDAAYGLFPVLEQRRDQRAGSLSGGEQQMLALGRVLVVGPKLIVADEMSLGLAPLMVNAVFDGLATAREDGVTVVLIEQFVHRALAFADDCAVISRGQVTWSGPAAEAGPQVLEQYLGAAAGPA
ncbi:MAG: ABC transporter ATP-binding protein [Pseudonocardia sp. SCN 73-27]|nr:MAG: ABC transporter ATP-binding protein [Pseudonocardia sp. SCN 72-51]ODV08827.1 MAG: ABC transporter ATP-binding protein [Pseudonocardia sp. SCN 73-27]